MSNSRRNLDESGTRKALVLAMELNLIGAVDNEFANGMLEIGIDIFSGWQNWLPQVNAKVSALEDQLKDSPYQHFIDGGPKPLKRNGRLDWAAKDAHHGIMSKLEELRAFRDSARVRMADGSTAKNVPAVIELVWRLITLHRGFRESPISSQVVSSIVCSDDIRLCLVWSNAGTRPYANLDTAYLRELVGDYEAARLVSARIAEHAAARYYRSLGQNVEDVSVGQLSGRDDRWKAFDLQVNQQPVDVKNARRSFSSPDTYVQHCVPRFKESRRSEVAIVGVLSDYIMLDELVDSPSTCRILGEVTISKIRKLFVWARERFGNFLKLDGMWKPGYQPGWVFEYPDLHYQSRGEIIKKIPDLLKRFRDFGVAAEQLPRWLLAMCPDRATSLKMSRPGFESKVLRDLHSLEDSVGISRPTLFVLVLGLILESIFQRDTVNRPEGTLRSLLLVNSSPDFQPLGLEDPQNYIANLIDGLTKVRQKIQERGLVIKTFWMSHPSILRGQLETDTWITLLAYCGGWRDYPFAVRCGASPLNFGLHDTCPICGHLICDVCGFCSFDCELVGHRQSMLAERMRRESGQSTKIP